MDNPNILYDFYDSRIYIFENDTLSEENMESGEEDYVQGALTIPISPARNFPPISNIRDSFTGTVTNSNFQIWGRNYEAKNLADFFITTKDLRDPVSGMPLTADDLQAIVDATVADEEYKKSLLQISSVSTHRSITTTAKKYFLDNIDNYSMQLLTLCELESMSSLTEFEPLYFSCYIKIVQAFCGLIKQNPLSASAAAVKIQLAFDQAWAVSTDESDTYIHEPKALGPAFTSITNLTKCVHSCIRKENSNDAVLLLSSLKPIPVQNGSSTNAWNRLVRGLAYESISDSLNSELHHMR
jgi:hypothetical protein